MKKLGITLASALLVLAVAVPASAADRRPIVTERGGHFCDACHLITLPPWGHAGHVGPRR